MIFFFYIFNLLWFYLGSSLYNSLFFFVTKTAFLTRLCLFFVTSFVILNENEIDQFFLIVSLISTLLVFVVSIWIACREFTHFFFVRLTAFKFVFFTFTIYALFLTFSFVSLFLILQYNLDILFFDLIFLRFSFFEKTIFIYLIFILMIFFSDSIKDKTKFALTHFYQRFLEFLPPVFFFLLLFSFAFLTFNTNFFIIYILALITFFLELKSFYHKIWTPQIQNSSFVWHILRFSSGVPFLFYDFIIFETAFAGATVSLETKLLPQGRRIFTTQGTYPKWISQQPKGLRNFSIWSPKDLDLIPQTQKLILASLEKDPTNFRDMDRTALEASGLFSYSELSNNAAEIAQTMSLKKMPGFADKYLLPTGLKFFEESVFAINPSLTHTKRVECISDWIAYKHKNAPDFTAVALASDRKTYMFSKNGAVVTYKRFSNAYLAELFENTNIAWDFKALGKSYNSALRTKVYDILVLDKNLEVVQPPIDLKVKPFLPKDKSTISQLAQLDPSTKNHVLYFDFQKSESKTSRIFEETDYSIPNVRDFIEERRDLTEKIQEDTVLLKVKQGAAEQSIEDFVKTNNKKK